MSGYSHKIYLQKSRLAKSPSMIVNVKAPIIFLVWIGCTLHIKFDNYANPKIRCMNNLFPKRFLFDCRFSYRKSNHCLVSYFNGFHVKLSFLFKSIDFLCGPFDNTTWLLMTSLKYCMQENHQVKIALL